MIRDRTRSAGGNAKAAEELWRKAAAAFQRGDLDAAEPLSRAVLDHDPHHSGALHGLGLIECQRGRPVEGVHLLREALRLDPTNASGHFNLGVALYQLEEFAASVLTHRQAIALRPDYAEGWSSLSASLFAQGDFAAAADAARHALDLAPHLVAASANLSVALRALGDEAGALETILASVRRNPDQAEAWFWMGQTLHLRGEMSAAISAYDRAIAIDPNHILAHGRRATAWLAIGDFARGWPEYEWRLRAPGANPQRLSQPRWAGDPLAGRTVLLRAEQGLGDAIQMLRYVERVARDAAQVLVEVDAALLPLVPRRGNVIPVVRGGTLPSFDVYCPLLSLPLAFGTTIDDIPGGRRYLQPDPARVEAWEHIIGSEGPGRRVGVVWAGNPRHQHDRDRSVAFDTLAPLFTETDIAWFSLQVGPTATDAKHGVMTNLAPQLRDLGETAAAIVPLDLVIAVDTAVAHLAGALGVPVWILLPVVPDWRWLLEREDSPWYPSARLFRQRTAGDWTEVIGRVRTALGSGCAAKHGA